MRPPKSALALSAIAASYAVFAASAAAGPLPPAPVSDLPHLRRRHVLVRRGRHALRQGGSRERARQPRVWHCEQPVPVAEGVSVEHIRPADREADVLGLLGHVVLRERRVPRRRRIHHGSPITPPSGAEGPEGPPTYEVLRATRQPPRRSPRECSSRPPPSLHASGLLRALSADQGALRLVPRNLTRWSHLGVVFLRCGFSPSLSSRK